jgi:hypothetical protein
MNLTRRDLLASATATANDRVLALISKYDILKAESRRLGAAMDRMRDTVPANLCHPISGEPRDPAYWKAEKEWNAVVDATFGLEDEIIETPAATLEGARGKVRVLADKIREDHPEGMLPPDIPPAAALGLSLAADIERLTGRAQS